ncbi:MAG TPA: GntR family transcriptional regulator [Chloroflexota bacterium]|nr:GntR family transcriptional regulator [Chloroflexota bacterium]
MAINRLGPRSGRVYALLRERILEGELTPGTKLPPHTELAAEFGVAPLTLRHVLASLEEEGLVSREQGRGTFVRARSAPAVLIVDDDALMRGLLHERVARGGYRPVEADGPTTGLAALEQDPDIALVLSDIRMPASADGIGFIRAVRRRWPALPLAAVTGYPADLDELHGTPECPVLILPKPFRVGQIDEVLRLALRPGTLAAAGSRR